MPDSSVPSAWQIERTLAVWHAIHERLAADGDLEPDEERILDEFRQEGVQHPDALLSRLIDAVRWCAMRETEADELRKEMRDRRDRYAGRGEWLRGMVADLLEILNKTSHKGRIATALYVAGRAHVIITDQEALPAEYVKTTVTVNKELITEHIEAGVVIPGAEMSNPMPTLQIRKAR